MKLLIRIFSTLIISVVLGSVTTFAIHNFIKDLENHQTITTIELSNSYRNNDIKGIKKYTKEAFDSINKTINEFKVK